MVILRYYYVLATRRLVRTVEQMVDVIFLDALNYESRDVGEEADSDSSLHPKKSAESVVMTCSVPSEFVSDSPPNWKSYISIEWAGAVVRVVLAAMLIGRVSVPVYLLCGATAVAGIML